VYALTKKQIPLNALKGKIREEGQSLRKLSPLVGIATNTLCLKINGKYDFTCSEIARMCEALNIEPEDIPKYFFPQMLRNATKNNKKTS